jgi:hypothetical protein
MTKVKGAKWKNRPVRAGLDPPFPSMAYKVAKLGSSACPGLSKLARIDPCL